MAAPASPPAAPAPPHSADRVVNKTLFPDTYTGQDLTKEQFQ